MLVSTDDISRSVGAPVANGSSTKVITLEIVLEKYLPPQDLEADLRELQNYDKKVLLASREMSLAMAEKLQIFGIPFFGVPDRLLRESEPRLAKEKTSREELTALQLKMLSLLEDLCG